MKTNPALAFVAFVCAAITLGFAGTAIYTLTISNGWIASLIFLPFIAVMAWLTRLTWRQARGIPDPDLLQSEGDTLVWRGSQVRAWGSFIGAGALALLALGLGAALVGAMAAELGWGERIGIAALLAALLVLFAALAQLLWRNGKGFHRARIVLAADALHLELPRWRSLIHRLPPVCASHPWSQIAAIETRHEAYSSQGMAMLQRPYWLVLKGGERIFLFEDRGIGSHQETRSLDPVASAIADRAEGAWRELPLAEGKGGIMGAWGTAPPKPGARPPDAARREVLARRVAFTAQLAAWAFGLVMLARGIAWMFE